MHPADQLKKLLGFNFGIETVNSIHKTDFFGKSSGITAIEGDPAVFPGILLVSDILYSFIVFQDKHLTKMRMQRLSVYRQDTGA